MVFSPLEDWKVQLFIIGMFGKRSRQLVGWLLSCWEEKWLDDKTDTTSRLIPKWDKLCRDQLAMSSLRHITPSSRHMMMSNALQSPLDRSSIVSGCLSGKHHALFIMWSFSIMLYHLFSHTMSYAPILTHPQTNFFPMMTFSLCPCWFIRSHDPLHFLTILPIVLTLLLAFVSYCCSIYGSHVCGVLSWPQFCI